MLLLHTVQALLSRHVVRDSLSSLPRALVLPALAAMCFRPCRSAADVRQLEAAISEHELGGIVRVLFDLVLRQETVTRTVGEESAGGMARLDTRARQLPVVYFVQQVLERYWPPLATSMQIQIGVQSWCHSS